MGSRSFIGTGKNNVYENFKESIHFDGNRYVTNLPFKPHHDFLPDNYELSTHRLFDMKKRLDKNPELLSEYIMIS